MSSAGWIGLVVTALVAFLLLNSRRSPTLTISVENDQLTVRMLGWDAAYCCRRKIIVPLDAVDGVCVARREDVPTEGFRLPGTGIPGVIRAGSYGTGDQRDFWDVRRAAELLVIQLKPGAGEYRRIVLEVPDPRDRMMSLRPLLGPAVLPQPLTK